LRGEVLHTMVKRAAHIIHRTTVKVLKRDILIS
jgi:hypothetical protein